MNVKDRGQGNGIWIVHGATLDMARRHDPFLVYFLRSSGRTMGWTAREIAVHIEETKISAIQNIRALQQFQRSEHSE